MNPVCSQHPVLEPKKGYLLACVWRAKCSTITPPQDAKDKVERLEVALQSAETGQDLSSCRRLQKQHRQLEGESQALASQIAFLLSQAHWVASSQPITEETRKYLQRCSPAHSVLTPLCVTLP